MKPTIEDIARASGVSKGTVSRVLNGHRAVAATTRERVLGIMAHLGYEPDPAARHLSWRTGRSLGLSMLPGDPLLSPYQVLFRRALERETARLGLALSEVPGELSPTGPLPSAMLVMHVREDDARLAVLRTRVVPTVLVGHHPDWPWVAPDDRDGAALAARALVALGHRDLLFVGDGDSQVARDRREGFLAAAREAGVRAAACPAEFSVLGGYRALRRLADDPAAPPFTALFGACDELAVGAVAALVDAGRRVPADVSVIGFDGLPELPATGGLPGRLTTVAQDIEQIAQEALNLVLETLAGGPPRGVYVPVRFVVGDTTAPPGGVV